MYKHMDSLGYAMTCLSTQQTDQTVSRRLSKDGDKMLRQVLEYRRRTLGPDHDDTLSTEANLASNLASRGSPDVVKMLEQLIPRLQAANHPHLGEAQQLLDMIRP